jgi:Protein of unknown function (DUF4242)
VTGAACLLHLLPIYFDLHPPAEVSARDIREGLADARSGTQDRHRVRQIDYYCAIQGAIYCVLEAPSPDAIRARHAAQGLPCREVVVIDGLEGQLPLSAQDRRVLDEAIRRDWQARESSSDV